MSAVARAAQEYREAEQALKAARRLLVAQLLYAKEKEGRPVRGEDGLAAELGVSVARVYQLLEKER